MGKKQIWQNYKVLKYFMWSRNPYNSQTTKWVNSHIPELVWQNTHNSLVPLYHTDLGLMETLIHQCLGMCKFPCHGNILWKAISFLGCGLVKKLELIWKTKQSPEHESSKISCYGNNKGKTTLFPSYGL